MENEKQIEVRVRAGKPFIVGQFVRMDIQEQMCRVAGNPAMKENRVIRKFTVMNANGVHVHSDFMEPGSRVERDSAGAVVKVFDKSGVEVKSSLKVGDTVIVDLRQYDRDGVGYRIAGECAKL